MIAKSINQRAWRTRRYDGRWYIWFFLQLSCQMCLAGFQWHLLYSFSNPLLPNRLWLEAQLYCRLPSGYVDPNTYYLEPGYLYNDDNNILQLDDLNRRASIPTSLSDPTSSESYNDYGKSVLSSVMQHLQTGNGKKELLDLAVNGLEPGSDHLTSSGLVQVSLSSSIKSINSKWRLCSIVIRLGSIAEGQINNLKDLFFGIADHRIIKFGEVFHRIACKDYSFTWELAVYPLIFYRTWHRLSSTTTATNTDPLIRAQRQSKGSLRKIRWSPVRDLNPCDTFSCWAFSQWWAALRFETCAIRRS